MRRVLIITYYWSPTGGSGVQRWVKFSKYLARLGWQPVIYTPSNPEQISTDHSLERDIPEIAEIIKRPIREPYSIYKKLIGKKGGSSAGVVNPINDSKKNWKEKLSLWIRANFFVPDPRASWIKPSVKFLTKYLKEHPVDVIVTTGPPQSMHLIGKGVREATGIPWIADFRDPWTKIFYFKHLPMIGRVAKKQSLLERSVLDGADIVVTVTDSFKRGLQELVSPETSLDKFYTIPNGFDEEDFPNTKVEVEEKFCITHTGLLASSGNPLKLWSLLGEKCKREEGFKRDLIIRLIGRTDKEVLDSIEESGLAENLENIGYLPHDEMSAWQRKAQLLLLPLRREPEAEAILPGKFFEYLAAGRPIISFCAPKGELAQMIKETESGYSFDWEEEESLSKTIDDLYNLYLEGLLGESSPEKKAKIANYSRRYLTLEMIALFEKL